MLNSYVKAQEVRVKKKTKAGAYAVIPMCYSGVVKQKMSEKQKGSMR